MNRDIRAAAVAAGVALWRLADEIGISETTLYRWLRIELSAEKKAVLLLAIDKLKKEESR